MENFHNLSSFFAARVGVLPTMEASNDSSEEFKLNKSHLAGGRSLLEMLTR